MVRIFKELGWFFKQEWYKFVLIIIFTITYTNVVLLPARYIGNIVDLISTRTLTQEGAMLIAFKMFVVALLIYLTAALKGFLLGGLFHKLFYKLKKFFIVNIFKQDGDFFETYYSGDLITRATGDTNMVSRVSTHVLSHLFDTIMMLIIAFVNMQKLNLNLTLLAIIPLPLIFFIVLYLRPKIMANWRKVRKEVSHLNNLVMESVSHVRLVRGFVREDEDELKLSTQADDVYKVERKAVLMQSVFAPTFRMVTLLSLGIALGYGSYLIMNQKDFSVGNLITFNLYLGMFASPLFRLGNQITIISQSGVSFDRLYEILGASPTIKDVYGAKNLKEVKSIDFVDLAFKYPSDTEYTIQDININLNAGETLGIVGKTGSGKTTLVRQLLRQFPISEGALLINGRPIESYSKNSIRLNIAYVPQEHELFSRTVLENLRLGESFDATYSVDDAITMADFKKDLVQLEYGIDTIVGEAGVTLSGGQKQRLSIARAFLKNSDILIMDDSLSAVDGVTEANIVKNLKEYRMGRTNIICSHRLSAIEHADKIIVLEKGRIVETGTHEELMLNKKWYYEQYIVQQMEGTNEEEAL